VKTEEKIFNYIKSNQLHSTLIGKVIIVENSDKNDDDVLEFSQWMADFIEKSENYNKKINKKKNR
jgi:hypothetical protein